MKVPSAGSYAVNVLYNSGADVDITVKVNKNCGGTLALSFKNTVEWCNNNGSTTVVPIELQGFQKGVNTLTFSQATTSESPMIEWISVVLPFV